MKKKELPKEDPLDVAYREWSSGKRTPEDNHRFVSSMDGFLRSAVTSYATAGDPTAFSEARRLALKAAAKFDPAHGAGAKLKTHLHAQLQALYRFAATRAQPLKIPEAARYEAAGLAEAAKELADRLGRDPTDHELADHSGLSMKRIRHIRSFAPAVAEGQLAGDDGETPELAMRKGYVPEEDDWVTAVYHGLPAVWKKVFEWRTGYNGNPKLKVSQIARKLGISEGRVSQIAAAIGKQLAERPDGV